MGGNNKKKSAAPQAPAPRSPMEQLLGTTLLTKDGSSQPTSTVLKGKELVGIYFSASWCRPCQTFTPVLATFYESVAADHGLEIVFVSSDQNAESFKQYHGKMPWAAIPYDGAEDIKAKLGAALHIRGIPALIILDGKTGHFVTDTARASVMETANDKQNAQALIQSWKSEQPVPLEEARFSGDQQSLMSLSGFISLFMKNPMYLIGLYYMIRQLLKYLSKLGEEKDEQEAEL